MNIYEISLIGSNHAKMLQIPKRTDGKLLAPIQNVSLQKVQQNEEVFQDGGFALNMRQ